MQAIGSNGQRPPRATDDQIVAALDAMLDGIADKEDWEMLRWFAFQRARRLALEKGITNHHDLRDIGEEVSLRFLEAIAKGRLK